MFDKTGAIRNWWSTASEENFQEKEKCIIDQYNGYVVPEIGENVRSLRQLKLGSVQKSYVVSIIIMVLEVLNKYINYSEPLI